MTSRFTAVVPVKAWDVAKRRLVVPAALRAQLAEAFARDVLDVLAASERVERIVVVGPSLPAAEAGVERLDDPGLGLVEAVLAGVRVVDEDVPVLVVPADLPCLTPSALDEALRAGGRHDRAMVVDAMGTGTTLLMARRPDLLDPAYGPASADRHAARGHVTLDAGEGVRHDVDTTDDLAAAMRLGLGAATASVLERHRGEPAA